MASSDETTVDMTKVDKRLVEKKIRDGEITLKQMVTYKKTLPDLSNEAEEIISTVADTSTC